MKRVKFILIISLFALFFSLSAFLSPMRTAGNGVTVVGPARAVQPLGFQGIPCTLDAPEGLDFAPVSDGPNGEAVVSLRPGQGVIFYLASVQVDSSVLVTSSVQCSGDGVVAAVGLLNVKNQAMSLYTVTLNPANGAELSSWMPSDATSVVVPFLQLARPPGEKQDVVVATVTSLPSVVVLEDLPPVVAYEMLVGIPVPEPSPPSEPQGLSGDDVTLTVATITVRNLRSHLDVADGGHVYVIGDFQDDRWGISGAPMFEVSNNTVTIDLADLNLLDGVNRFGLKNASAETINRMSFSEVDRDILYRQTDASSPSGAGDWAMAISWNPESGASPVPEGTAVVSRDD